METDFIRTELFKQYAFLKSTVWFVFAIRLVSKLDYVFFLSVAMCLVCFTVWCFNLLHHFSQYSIRSRSTQTRPICCYLNCKRSKKKMMVMNSSKILCLILLTLRNISGTLGVAFISFVSLLWLSWSCPCTLCTGSHFEPAPSLHEKCYHTSKVRLYFSTKTELHLE